MNTVVICLLLSGYIGLTAGDAFVSVKFLTFRNPSGEGSNGHCCDGRFFLCGSDCDHSFHICLDQIDGPANNIRFCTYGRSHSGEISNQNAITFKNKIGNLDNPLIWRLGSWPGQVRLKIDVNDVDDINDGDHVDYLQSAISVLPSSSSQGRRYRLKNRVELNIEVRVYCGKNYYGLNCSVHCEPTDDHTGHYTCDKDQGTKICNTGWTGVDCDVNEDNCVWVTCRNGGSCQDLINGYKCACSEGYEGRLCEREINECLIPNNCHHGDCVNTPGSFTCSCHTGYTGPACEENVDDCANSPCQNGARCVDLIGGFSCQCVVGFTGTLCDGDVDECTYAPCANNGTCRNSVGAYRCDCLLGYRGNDCSLDVDECDRGPCMNNGSCTNYLGGYECLCQVGFQGFDCEEDVDECHIYNNTCKNDATCINTHGSYHCACASGYHGHNCEMDEDECETYPCKNGGICQNLPGNFSCDCAPGFTGSQCGENIDECSLDICKNGATCTDTPGSFHCACSSYWTGPTCQENVNECLSSPCQNGGACENVDEGFICKCPREFLGRLCEQDLNECELDDTCFNNGTCVNSFGGFLCDCPDGWRGQKCEEDIDECSVITCNNMGTCVNTDGGFRCECPINWSGVTCEIDVDECSMFVSPCKNNATCNNMPGTFHCECTEGWAGALCDEDVDECKEDPDLCTIRGNSTSRNATDLNSSAGYHRRCMNTVPGYVCTCAEGWTGQLCDVDIDECNLQTTSHSPDSDDAVTTATEDIEKNSESHGASEQVDISTKKAGENTSGATVDMETDIDQETGGLSVTESSNISSSYDALRVPFYLACRITASTRWTVNKGLKELFEDTNLFKGKQLTVDHREEIGTSEDGEVVTSIHPIVTMDGRELSDFEIEHVLSKVSNNKLESYLYCPLFLDAVTGKFSFSTEPLSSDTPNWYLGLIIACSLLLLVAAALVFIKCHRSKQWCKKDYQLRSVEVSRSLRNEIYTDAIYTFSQLDDQNKTSDLHQDHTDTTALVKISDNRKVISIQNPLYTSLDEMRETEEEEADNKANQAAEENKSASTSEDDVPDGQPSTPAVGRPASDDVTIDANTGEHEYSVPQNNACAKTGKVDATTQQQVPLNKDTANQPKPKYLKMRAKKMRRKPASIVNAHRQRKGNSQDENKGSKVNGGPYVNMDAKDQHNVPAEADGKAPVVSSFGDGKSRRGRELSHRRRKASDAEYEKYKNLPYIDDPAYADMTNRGHNHLQS